MDPLKGVLVQIISDGEPLELYDDPDAQEAVDEDYRRRYVEAVTGSSFTVRVLLTTDFDLRNYSACDYIQVRLKLDAIEAHWSDRTVCADIEKRFLRGRAEYFIFSSIVEFDLETEQWVEKNFCFGNLETSTSYILSVRHNTHTLSRRNLEDAPFNGSSRAVGPN